MRERQGRLIVVLVSLVVILALLYRFSGPSVRDGEASAETDKIWAIDPGVVEGLFVTEGDKTVHLQRRLGQWQFVDAEWKAHAGVIMETLDDLSRLNVSAVMEEVDLAEFGFGDGPNKTVKLSSATTEHLLVIGSLSPTGQETYVHTGGKNVFAVDGDVSGMIKVEPDFFRDRHLLNFELTAVRSLSVESPRGTLHLTGQGREWWLEGYARADVNAVEDLLVALRGLQVQQFLPVQPGDDIQEPIVQVSIELEDGVVHTLKVGRSTPLGALVRAGAQQGFLVPEMLSFLTQGPVDLVARRLLLSAPEEIVGLHLNLGEREWLVEQGTHSGSLIANLAQALVELSVVYRDEPLPEISTPQGLLTVFDEDGAELGAFELGQVVDGEHRLVRNVVGGPPLLLVEKEFQAFVGRLPSP